MPRGRPKKVIAATMHSNVASAEIDHKEPVRMAPENPKETFDESPATRKIESAVMAAKGEFIDTLDEYLETPFYSLNKLIPQFRESRVSPDPRDWYVRYFFPNAKGGPIYVDAPHTKHELEICRKKAEIMKRLNLKYLLFRPEEDIRLGLANETIKSHGKIGDEMEIPAGEQF